jgi:hypothetical protein
VRGKTRGFHLRDFLQQHQPQLGIFVTQVDIDVLRLDHPGGDQHALDETVRIAAKVIAVLEGAGLALVAVDGHQARTFFRTHQGPLASGGKARAAKPAQAGIVDRLDHLLARAHAVEA